MEKFSNYFQNLIDKNCDVNLFGQPVPKKRDGRKGITSDRQAVLQTVLEEMAKEGYKPNFGLLLRRLKRAGVKTTHQIYVIISESKDYRNRGGKDASFVRGFYGILKNYEKNKTKSGEICIS